MAHVLRSNIGVQFTRRSIGQVIRLLTNIILFSNAKGLVLLSFWTLSLWNFDIETVPMTNRSMETMDRTEEATLTSQGWVPFVSATNWKETQLTAPSDSATPFDTLSYAWTDAQFVLASNLDVVLKGKTSSRLVCLLDAIAYSLANPSRHGSGSIRYSALEALMKLLQKIPLPVLALASRWIHAVLASLFDSGLPAGTSDVALCILTLASQHWSGATQNFSSSAVTSGTSASNTPSTSTTSIIHPSSAYATLGAAHVVHYCLTQSRAFKIPSGSTNTSTYSETSESELDSSKDASQDVKEPPHLIWSHLQKCSKSKDPRRLIAVWGPLVLCLRDGLLKHNLINAMLKLLQGSFTHAEPAIRVLAFNAWSFLIRTFTQTSAGIRMAKRLKLLLLPIANALKVEEDLSVLHAAFETYLQLLASLHTHLYLDWHVLLAQPLQLLLQNPFATVPYDVDPNHLQSSMTSASLTANAVSTVNALANGVNTPSSTSGATGQRVSPPPLPHLTQGATGGPSGPSATNNTGTSLPNSTQHAHTQVQLSMIQRFCLLVCHLMERDASGNLISSNLPSQAHRHGPANMASSAGITLGFDPNELCRVHHTQPNAQSPEFKAPLTSIPLLRVAAAELHIQRILNKLHVEAEYASPVWKSLPSLSGYAPWHSFLSLVFFLINRCITDTASGKGPKQDLKQRSDRVLARHLWTALCLNLDSHLEHLRQLQSRSRTSEAASAANWMIRGVSFDPANIAAWSVSQLVIASASSEEATKEAWSDYLDEAMTILSKTFSSLVHMPTPSSESYQTTLGYLCQWLIQPRYLDSPESMVSDDNATSLTLPPVPFFGVCDAIGHSFDVYHERNTLTRKDTTSQYARRLYASIEQIVAQLLSTLPNRSSGALDPIHALLEHLQPTSAYAHLQHISQELSTSNQDASSSTLQDVRLRLSLSYMTWQLFGAVLRDNIKNTCRIYPHHIYHQSSPTKSRQNSHEEKIGEVKTEHGYEAPTTSTTSGATTDSSTFGDRHDSVALKGTNTLPSMYTMGIAGHSSITRVNAQDDKSSTTASDSNGTTPTKPSFSTSASNTSDSSVLPTETKHPRILLSHILACIVYPLQQTKRTLSVITALHEDSHPGSVSTVAYLLETVFTTKLRDTLAQEMAELIKETVSICSHRFVDLSTLPSYPSSLDSLDAHFNAKTGPPARAGPKSIANLSAIFYASAIQLLHQLRDHTTFMQLDAAKADTLGQHSDNATNGTQSSKSISKGTLLRQQARLWYLALWNDVFVTLVDGLTQTMPFRPPTSQVPELLWSWRDTTSYSTSDLLSSAKELSEGAKLLSARVSNATSRSNGNALRPSKPSTGGASSLASSQHTRDVSSKAKELTLSPFPKEDLSYFFELSIPDWSIVWSERSENVTFGSSNSNGDAPGSSEKPQKALSKISTSSSSSTATSSTNSSSSTTQSISHLEFPLFSKMPQPDDTGDESKMSDWSRFMRRIVCCYGMVWRSTLAAAKGIKSTPHSPPGDRLMLPTSQSEEIALAIVTSVRTSALRLLEKWQYGNNLLIDILPVIVWALASDAATAKVIRVGSAVLVGAVKKPLENLSGATLACITRTFGSLVGDSGASLEVQARPSTVNANAALMALYERSSPVWSEMLESKRPNVKSSVSSAWNHSFGRVMNLDVSLAPQLAPIVHKIHSQATLGINLQEPTEWSKFLERGTAEMMDIDEPIPAKVNPSPSIPAPATLFPMEHKHKHNPEYVFGDSIELDTPTELGVTPAGPGHHTSPYKPIPASALKKDEKALDLHPSSKVKPSNITMKFPNPVQTHGLKLAPAAIKHEPSPDASPPATHSTINNATMTLAVPGEVDGTTEPLTTDPNDSNTLILPPAPSAGNNAIAGTNSRVEEVSTQLKFQQWSAALKGVSQNVEPALQDQNVSMAHLIEAQQTVIQLLSAITNRMTKG